MHENIDQTLMNS